MKAWTWLVPAAGSVAILAAAGLTAVAVGPSDSRLWLAFCVVFAVATAVQAVASEPRELTAALLFSLPPVISLVAEGSPTWLVGPLGVSLLLAGELNALSWDFRGRGVGGAVPVRRLERVGLLTALAFAAVLTVAAASEISILGGTTAFALAAVALTVLGEVLFRRRS